MATGHLTIDLSAIRANWRALDAMSGPDVVTGACVKADGYGLGAADVARALAAEGCQRFYVAVASEALALRKALGEAPEIAVFSGHMTGDAETLRAANAIPMLNAPEQIARHRADLPGHAFGVQLDTGMNRLGLEPADWAGERDALLAEGPVLVMSHLACADEPDHDMNAVQLAAFRGMTDGIDAPRSLAATGGILLGSDYHFDATRPGIGLYGAAPFGDALPVVTLSVPIIQTRSLSPGETVGYGNSWTATEPARIATIAVGYADGFIRSGSNIATVWAGDTPCPIRGRVSMDLITVDVTHLDDEPAALDLIGPMQGVDALADQIGTIGYEILTSLGARYERRYLGVS